MSPELVAFFNKHKSDDIRAAARFGGFISRDIASDPNNHPVWRAEGNQHARVLEDLADAMASDPARLAAVGVGAPLSTRGAQPGGSGPKNGGAAKK